jgi:uncharacterized membrane protein
MKGRVFLTICVFLGLVALPLFLASAEQEALYWYRDFNGDNVADDRIVFTGDLTTSLMELVQFEKADLCSSFFKDAWFTSIECLNLPPCPGSQPFCKPFGRKIIVIITTGGPACHCVSVGGGASSTGKSDQTCVYVRSEDGTFHRLSMSEEEFERYLINNFQVIAKGLQDCDSLVVAGINWSCDGLECPPDEECEKNLNAEWTGFVTVGPICACVESAPSLTTWGIIALVVLLIASAGFLMLRRKKAVVTA